MKKTKIYGIVMYSLMALIFIVQIFVTDIKYVYIQIVLAIVFVIVTVLGIVEKRKEK
ncbi:MAG: hypothetical protein ABJN84_00140 [Flavobacteriaceae bacterium]